MLKQSDIEGRLRLFRYGLIVVTVITFLVAIVVPMAYLNPLQAAFAESGQEIPGIGTFIPTAILVTVVVAVISVAAYFAYAAVLKRTVSGSDADTAESGTSSATA